MTNRRSSGGALSGGSSAGHGGASFDAIVLAWILRGAIGVTAIVHAIKGELLYVALCLGAIALLTAPALIARSSRANLPVEIEIIVLWWFVGDMTLGRAAALYDSSLWFDKVLHFGNSILVGLVAFVIVYLLHMTCCISGPRWVTGALIVVVTLGIGAGWEIVEFAADSAFQRGAQGSPLMPPLQDTMWDLILDGVGGFLGAAFGPAYMRGRRSRNRVGVFRQLAGLACDHSGPTLHCRSCGDGSTLGSLPTYNKGASHGTP